MPLWLIITGLGITQIIGWGTIFFIIGALSPDIAAATGWPQYVIFGAFSGALLLGGVIAKRTGRLIDERGGRWLVPLGSLLCAVGSGIIGVIHSEAAYITGWLLLGVGMRLATYDAVFASLTQISPEKARRSISALTLMGGLSSTIFWPLNSWLGHHIGWSGVFLAHAALHLFVCLPIHLLLLRDARPITHEAFTAGSADPLQGHARTTAIVMFTIALSLSSFIFSALSAHMLPMFKGIGFTATEAVTIASLIGPAQVASRLGEMLLGRNMQATMLGALSFGLVPVAFLILIAGGFTLPAALGFAFVYGASNGVITIARGVVPLALFGRDGYAEVLGIIGAPGLALSAMAPLIFAWVLGVVSAATAFMLLALAALVSSLSMLLLHRLNPR